jgi:hypothetical protein
VFIAYVTQYCGMRSCQCVQDGDYSSSYLTRNAELPACHSTGHLTTSTLVKWSFQCDLKTPGPVHQDRPHLLLCDGGNWGYSMNDGMLSSSLMVRTPETLSLGELQPRDELELVSSSSLLVVLVTTSSWFAAADVVPQLFKFQVVVDGIPFAGSSLV